MAYIVTCLGVVFLRLLSYLPYPWVARFGECLGYIAFYLPSKRKQIVLANLKVCFPDWTKQKRYATARQVFCCVVRSFAERGLFWFGSAKRIRKWVKIDDQANLAKFKDTPYLMMGMHLVGIEAGALRLSLYLNELGCGGGVTLYTTMRNAYFDQIVKRVRERFGARMFSRSKRAKRLLGLIRSGAGVQLAPDMDFGLSDSEFVDFFGVPACTLTAIPRLARLTGAVVIPVVPYLLPNYQGYVLHILEPWDNYPTTNIRVDTERMNAFFEDCIRHDPAQYYWVHRRFKTRPDNTPPIY